MLTYFDRVNQERLYPGQYFVILLRINLRRSPDAFSFLLDEVGTTKLLFSAKTDI